MSSDPIRKLEHDHVPLGQLVGSLQEALEAVERKGRPPIDIYPAFADALSALHDELLEHFAREEEGLFPMLLRELPDLRAEVDAVQAAHDGVCGTIARLTHLAQRGPEAFVEHFAQVRGMFDRFESAYTTHTNEERALLRRADARLDARQREELTGVMKEL